MQSKRNSVIESVASTLVGLIVNFFVTYYIVAPFLHLKIDVVQNTGIVVVSALGTIIKNYFVRRFFVKVEQRDKPE